MQRPVLALLVSTLILGSVGLYARFTASLPVQRSVGNSPVAADTKYDVELQFTCPLEADPFVLDQKTSLLVQCEGVEIMRREGSVDTNQPIVLEQIANVVIGKNVFYVKAIPAGEHLARPQAVRLRVLNAGKMVAEKTFWSSPGEPFSGELVLEVQFHAQEAAHD
jgi:hypothetical protein